jgi:hypothetical protein
MGEHSLLLVAPCDSCPASLTGEQPPLPASGVSGVNPLSLATALAGAALCLCVGHPRVLRRWLHDTHPRRMFGLALPFPFGKCRRYPPPCVVVRYTTHVEDCCVPVISNAASLGYIEPSRSDPLPSGHSCRRALYPLGASVFPPSIAPPSAAHGSIRWRSTGGPSPQCGLRFWLRKSPRSRKRTYGPAVFCAA